MRLSIDDGCVSDVRVANLAKQYGIQCIFYWPVEWQMIAFHKDYEPLSITAALSIAQDFEIGSHTINHRHLTAISTQEAQHEIKASKKILRRLFSQPITKFCPPRGYTNQELTKYTLSVYEEQRLTKGEHLVHIHPDSGANNNKPWRECITDKTTEIWGHSWEFDKYGLWEELEEFLRENLHS